MSSSDASKRGGGTNVARSISLRVLGGMAAAASLARLIRDWKNEFSYYVALLFVLVIGLVIAWPLIFNCLSAWWARQMETRKLALAIAEANLSKRTRSMMLTAFTESAKSPILPISAEVFSQVLRIASPPGLVGAPAALADPDQKLVTALSNLLLELYKRGDLTDQKVNNKIGLLIDQPASQAEVDGCVVDLPVVRTSSDPDVVSNLDKHRTTLIADVVRESLLRRDALSMKGSGYSMRFDVERFLFSSTRAALKPYMMLDAQKRFEASEIHTLLYIQREFLEPQMNTAMTQLASNLGARYCTFPQSQGLPKVTSEDFFKGKKVVLVEPLLIDDNMFAAACDFLVQCHASVVGVLVIFQEKNFNVQLLKHNENIVSASGGKDIVGQVILDLKPIR